MTTWKKGRQILVEHLRESQVPLKPFVESLCAEQIIRVPNTAVFLVANPDGVPNSLLHNLAHNQVLHERVIFMNIAFKDVPFVPLKARLIIEPIAEGFYRFKVCYGFMEKPDIPALLEHCRSDGMNFNLLATSFFVSRETIVPTRGPGMVRWREELFATMSSLSGSIVPYLNIPPNRVIELGTRVEI